MDNAQNHIAFLPFEELLFELKEQHNFVLGIDSHERINRLLNRYQKDQTIDADRIRYELCAILATSQEQQEVFDYVFDEFIERHSFEIIQKIAEQSNQVGEKIRRSRWRFQILSFVIGLLLTFLYLTYFYVKPIPGPVSAQLPGSHHVFFADSSSIRNLAPLLKDDIESRTWEFENGEEVIANPYWGQTFEHAGHQEARLTIRTKGGRKKSRFHTFHIEDPIRVKIRREKIEDKDLFLPQIQKNKIDTLGWSSHLKQAYEEAASAYRFLGRSYQWQLSDESIVNKSNEQSELLIEVPSEKVTIQLKVITQWQIGSDTLYWPAEAKMEISPPDPSTQIPAVPIAFKDLTGPDLDKLRALIEPRKANYLPVFIILLGLLLYALYELYRWRRRKLVLDQGKNISQPIRIDLEVPASGWPKFDDPVQEEALLALRVRQLGLGEKLDVPATLAATLESGGVPNFQYQTRSQAPHYLFLIEEKSARDHFAQYFGAWVKEMNRRDITAECYFYRRSPHTCWRAYSNKDSHRSLGQLLAAYGDYRLVFVGEAKGLFDLRSGKAGQVTHLLSSWHRKALLCPEVYNNWSWAEKQAQEFMPVLPANSDGLLQLSRIWSDESHDLKLSRASLMEPEAPFIPADPAEEEEADWSVILEEVRPYLGMRGMQWLAATAIYPEMEWELSLNLGRALGFYYDEQLALRLFRLPWFRTGILPEALRAALYDELSQAQRKDAMDYLISLLNHHDNLPASQSFAEQEHRSQMAIYRFLSSDKSPAARAALDQVIRSLPPEEIQDQVIRKGLAEASHNPLKLPAQLYRKDMAYFGFNQKARNLGFALAALFFAGLWWATQGNPFLQGLPKEPFNENMLRADIRPEQHLLWDHYIAWEAADSTNYEDAVKIFEKSMAKVSNIELIDKSSLSTLVNDYHRAAYNLLLQERQEIIAGKAVAFGLNSLALEKFVYSTVNQEYWAFVSPSDTLDDDWLLANSYVFYGDQDLRYEIISDSQLVKGYLTPFIFLASLHDRDYFKPSSSNAFFEEGRPARDSLLKLLSYLEEGEQVVDYLNTIDSIRAALGAQQVDRGCPKFVIAGHTRPLGSTKRLSNASIKWGETEVQSQANGYFQIELDTCEFSLATTRLQISRTGYRDTLWYITQDDFYEIQLTKIAENDPNTNNGDRNIKGLVLHFNSISKGIENAEVAEQGVVSVSTNKAGEFELAYGDPEENRIAGDDVYLSVYKQGFEVINEEALDVKMGQRGLVRVYMAPYGYIDSLQDIYYQTLYDAVEAEYSDRMVKINRYQQKNASTDQESKEIENIRYDKQEADKRPCHRISRDQSS